MFKITVFLCCLYFCALTPFVTLAMTPEQKAKIHAHFETIGKICIKDNVISPEDINDLRARKVPSGANAPCFLACMMKECGVMDSTGNIQKETALELAKSVFEDPEEIQNIEEYLHSCGHINSEPVTDGDKGCDRAILAFKCMTENASKFGFEV